MNCMKASKAPAVLGPSGWRMYFWIEQAHGIPASDEGLVRRRKSSSLFGMPWMLKFWLLDCSSSSALCLKAADETAIILHLLQSWIGHVLSLALLRCDPSLRAESVAPLLRRTCQAQQPQHPCDAKDEETMCMIHSMPLYPKVHGAY